MSSCLQPLGLPPALLLAALNSARTELGPHSGLSSPASLVRGWAVGGDNSGSVPQKVNLGETWPLSFPRWEGVQ